MKETSNLTSANAELFSQYNLGRIILLERINSGILNSSYRLMTSDDKEYFLREYHPDVTLKTVQNEVKLIKFLDENQVPVPNIIADNNGEFVFHTGDKFGFICEYVKGDFYPEERAELNINQLVNAAETLAKYHHFIQGYNQISWIPAETTNFTAGSFFSKQKAREIWNTALSTIAGKETTDEIDTQLALISKEKLAQIDLVDEFSLNDSIRQLPTLLAHGDYRPQNLIFLENKVKAITDWELARYQPRVWELVRAMCAFSKNGSTEIFNTPIDISRAKLFIEAYEKINTLLPVEKAIMFDLAYIGSLYPFFLLKSRYIRGNNRADFLVPANFSHWNWWSENRILVRNFVFGF